MAKEMFDKMIEELEKIGSILKTNKKTGKIPDIERDLMLSKLRIIYEFLLLYQPDFVSEKPAPQKMEFKIPEQSKAIVPDIPQEKVEQQPEIKIQTEKTVKPIIPAAQTTILAEKLNSGKSFLNEVLTQYANTNDFAKKFQSSPISNIFTAIGINEKFLFIKELFNENAELYKDTIEKLNQAAGFNEAIEYIDKNFLWNFDSSTVHKLLELIRRRHPLSPE